MTVFEVEQHSDFSFLPPSELHEAQHEAGRALVCSLLAKYSGKDKESVLIKTNEKGKPFTDDLHLSIAHSGTFVCAALSDRPVGIDIEPLRDFDERIVTRYFYPSEQGWLSQASDEGERRERFWMVWTAKEALLKRSGVGLSGLSECDTFAEMQGVRISQTVKDGYALCLAETVPSADTAMH